MDESYKSNLKLKKTIIDKVNDIKDSTDWHKTSNDIKAIAYDDTNDILHAGTASGRSEFQGLNRINNTTTGVALHISASDGLIAEQ